MEHLCYVQLGTVMFRKWASLIEILFFSACASAGDKKPCTSYSQELYINFKNLINKDKVIGLNLH